MHEALQFREQSVQPLHLEVSITSLKTEYRAKNPSTVPTGQTVLQYVLPLRHARTPRIASVRAATENVAALLIQTSVV